MHRSDIHACTQAGRNPKSAGKNGGGRVRTEERKEGRKGGRKKLGLRACMLAQSTSCFVRRETTLSCRRDFAKTLWEANTDTQINNRHPRESVSISG